MHIFVLLSGLAALSWEVLWQVKSTLALGVSAWGTAVTLSMTMGGMCLGALAMGQCLRRKDSVRPMRIYGILEILVGLSGFLLPFLFQQIENADTWVYINQPQYEPYVFISGIVATLTLPTLCLGATLPIIGLMARQYKTSIADLYGMNTLGAAAGALIAALLLIPALGITMTIYVVASLNILIGITAMVMDHKANEDVAVNHTIATKKKKRAVSTTPFVRAMFMVFITGFVTFALEIAWFRSFRAAFMSTTDAFAVMLASVLLALGLAARYVSIVKAKKVSLGFLMGLSGVSILLVTPIVERFDYVTSFTFRAETIVAGYWFIMTFVTVGLPIFLLGLVVPWLLEEHEQPQKWGALYGFNTAATILGAILAGWIFLPMIGFTKTAWLAGGVMVLAGVWCTDEAVLRMRLFALAAMGFAVAVTFHTNIGQSRVQGWFAHAEDTPFTVHKTYDAADTTTSAVKYEDGRRRLIIDGFIATSQFGEEDVYATTHYMSWMGHLPMLFHPDPEHALIVAFGTGQTSHAVRQENPKAVDIVDINPNVYKLAPFFTMNEGVLEDPRVNAIVMDGRAYIRRIQKKYDVITLEPMPPNFAGVNALYSQEFYQWAERKMNDDGVIAQWLPFHLVPAYYSASIAKTFQSVFPNSVLWIDPASGTGILLGSKNKDETLWEKSYGFQRVSVTRSLNEKEIKDAIFFMPDELERYGAEGAIVNDDNQLLAFGRSVLLSHRTAHLTKDNYEILHRIKGDKDSIQP